MFLENIVHKMALRAVFYKKKNTIRKSVYSVNINYTEKSVDFIKTQNANNKHFLSVFIKHVL